MTEQEGGYDAVDEMYRLTPVQWAQETRDWGEFMKALVIMAREKKFEDREVQAENLFEASGDSDNLKFAAGIWGLPDDVLDNVIASFDILTSDTVE